MQRQRAHYQEKLVQMHRWLSYCVIYGYRYWVAWIFVTFDMFVSQIVERVAVYCLDTFRVPG